MGRRAAPTLGRRGLSALIAEATRRGVTPPSQRTLVRYGLSVDEWLALLAAQGWKCPVCFGGRGGAPWNTDHEHVPGWKKLPPEERKRFVRGVLCSRCNRWLVGSRLAAAWAHRIADYLERYEARRDA